MSSGQRASTVTIRRDLTEMAEEITFDELNLAAERVAPSVGVNKESGRYPVLPREAIMKVPDTRRHSDGSYPRGQWEWEDDNYVTYEYGFEESVDNVDQLRDEEFIDLEEESTELATTGLMLGRESRVASALMNTTTFTGSTNTTAITNEWDDAANATPWADINSAWSQIRGKCGLPKKSCSIVITDDLIDYFFLTTEVKNVTQYTSYSQLLTSPRDAKARWMAEYLGVKEVIETRALYDTSGLASAASIGKFWTNEYIFLGVLCPAGSRLKTRGVIKQLVWTPYSSDYIIEDYEEAKYNRKIIRCREYRGYKVNTDYGHLLTNAKTTVNATTGI